MYSEPNRYIPMTTFDNQLATDDVLMMAPGRGGAEFGDEGSGATSGYGDTSNDDLLDEELDEEPLDADTDDDLRGDDPDDAI
jgi:hypothetical protein